MVQEWREGPAPLIEMYPTQANSSLGSARWRRRPPLASGARQSESRACWEAACGGMNLTCRWPGSKGSCWWVQRGGRGKGKADARGLRSVPGLPGLRAEGRGMAFSRSLGRFFGGWGDRDKDKDAVMLSGCVSLHRCGDAPVPAALVSSPLPFDDPHTLTHTYCMYTHMVSRMHACIHTRGVNLWMNRNSI